MSLLLYPVHECLVVHHVLKAPINQSPNTHSTECTVFRLHRTRYSDTVLSVTGPAMPLIPAFPSRPDHRALDIRAGEMQSLQFFSKSRYFILFSSASRCSKLRKATKQWCAYGCHCSLLQTLCGSWQHEYNGRGLKCVDALSGMCKHGCLIRLRLSGAGKRGQLF